MALSNTINRVQYASNGVATEFAVSFPFLDDEDLEVTLADADGDDATLTRDRCTIHRFKLLC